VFLDARGVCRSKVRCVPRNTSITLEEIETWNFDGSSTGQASGESSEVTIRPRVMYNDPFRGPPHVLVLCDNYDVSGSPSRQVVEHRFDALGSVGWDPKTIGTSVVSLVLTNTRHLVGAPLLKRGGG
jgi:glutamine synthetase